MLQGMKRRVFAVAAVALVVAAASVFAFSDNVRMRVERQGLAADVRAGITLRPVATGFAEITGVEFVPGRARTAVVLQKTGEASVLDLPEPAGSVAQASAATPFLKLAVRSSSELGLLGLAFHPKFRENGRFYLNYNPADGALRTKISEWYVPPDRLRQEPARERRVILEVAQPYPNHDGGQLVFGPDGMLYIGLGDGGYRGDPEGHGQNLATLLGAMLRIDIDGADPGKAYAVPKDNPFVGRAGAAPEIWAYGLRNPWRYSFDPRGRLIAADVGQNRFEEVSIVPRGGNLGWNVREGAHCYAPSEGCQTEGMVEPIFEYERSLGISITGGFVYTGKTLPGLAEKYVFADFASGRVWALELPDEPRPVPAILLGRFPHAISTFARDAAGELYAADFAAGTILRFVPETK